MYGASGASHGPHQVMREWTDKYKHQTINVKWAAAALPSVIGGPGKDFNGVFGIGPAMAARIAWSAAWARAPALV